ncbi:MAG: AAA family ATPase, partial [Methanobacterium sp.]|nr:AAA family ATPase [Methanobacterium sp.]
MNPRNKPENALGKGLDALIRKDYLDEEPVKSDQIKKKEKTSKKEEATQGKEKSDASSKREHDSISLKVNDEIVEAVLREVHKNPRISLWSAKSAAVLRFLKKTRPEFSISNEASLLI